MSIVTLLSMDQLIAGAVHPDRVGHGEFPRIHDTEAAPRQTLIVGKDCKENLSSLAVHMCKSFNTKATLSRSQNWGFTSCSTAMVNQI